VAEGRGGRAAGGPGPGATARAPAGYARRAAGVAHRRHQRQFAPPRFGEEPLAQALTATGRPEQAAGLFGLAERLRRETGEARFPPTRRPTSRTWPPRARLDEPAFVAAWAAGGTMTLEQALADALEEDGGGG
jgi:hypothetical protein